MKKEKTAVEHIETRTKAEIILDIRKIFNENVNGKKLDVATYNENHHGKEGHWLEKQMGVKHNASNLPDLFGFEMKNGTNNKTTFGDWTPNIDKEGNKIEKKWWNKGYVQEKKEFMQKYGKFNEDKKRYSWALPTKYMQFNNHGQKLEINNAGVFIIYNKNYDSLYENREMKDDSENQKILGWSHDLLKNNLENKFNKNGYFICKSNKEKVYTSIQFFDPITYDEWTNSIRNDSVFFDSGTKEGNSRPYMSWRAQNTWWTQRKTIE